MGPDANPLCPLAPSGVATLTAQWPGGGGAPSGVPGGRAIVVSPPYRAALDKWGTEREAEGHLYISCCSHRSAPVTCQGVVFNGRTGLYQVMRIVVS